MSSPIIPQDSALRVVKGSLGASITATAFGSIYGVLKGQSATQFAFQSGANTFVFAFPFFALREYVVSPLLEDSNPSIHTKNLTASAISGSAVGGAMSAYFRGPKKFIPGVTTFGILATALQFLGNELRVVRVHMLAGREKKMIEVGTESDTTTNEAVLRAPPSTTSSSSTSLPVDYPPPSNEQQEPQATSTTTSWLNQVGSYLSSFSPVTRLSGQEYGEQLNNRRRQVLERLREVEETIANEDAAKQKRV